LLKMRSEQLRIHLRSLPFTSTEGRKVRAILAAMQFKIKTLRQFECGTGKGRGIAPLH
jgi:hypothetical protein